MDLQTKIGLKIKNLRENRHLSQTQLAELVGYKDKTSIAKIEAGKVDLPQSKLMAFAKVLGVTTSYLLDDEHHVIIDFETSNFKNTLKSMITYFEKLNNLGQNEAIKRVEELTYLPQYSDDNLLDAAHSIENASEEDKNNDDDIMNNSSLWKN